MPEILVPPSREEIDQSPVVLILSHRATGKTATLNHWINGLAVYKVSRPEGGEVSVTQLQRPHIDQASYDVTEYCVRVGPHWIGVVDVPGEIVSRAPQEIALESIGMWRGDVEKLLPRVRGVLICMEPPKKREEGEKKGGVDDETAFNQVIKTTTEAEARPRDRRDLVTRLVDTVALARRSMDVHGRHLDWVVQFNFADLVGLPEGFVEEYGAELEGSWPVHVALPTLCNADPDVLGDRKRRFRRIRDLCERIYGDLVGPVRRISDGDYIALLAGHHTYHEFPTTHRSLALLYFVDRWYGEQRRQELNEADRVATRHKRWRKIAAAAILLIAGVLATIIWLVVTAYSDPSRLPSFLADHSCLSAREKPGPEDCNCLPRLLGKLSAQTPLAQRLDWIEPFWRECWGAPGLSAQATTGLYHFELLRSLVHPADLCPARAQKALQAGARLGALPDPQPLAPAMTASEQAYLNWLDARLAARSTDPVPASLPDGASQEVRVVVYEAAAVHACLEAWGEARRTGNWEPVTGSAAPEHGTKSVKGSRTNQADSSGACSLVIQRLPETLRTRLLVDAPPFEGVSTLPRSVPDAPGPKQACDGPAGLESLLLHAPPPDGFVQANLAAIAATPADFSAHLAKADGIEAAHRELLKLLGPESSPGAAVNAARALGQTEADSLAAVLRQPWRNTADGKVMSGKAGRRGYGRLPWFPMSRAARIACGLTQDPATAGFPLSPISPSDREMALAKFARILLDFSKRLKDLEWASCSAQVQWTLYRGKRRSSPEAARSSLLQELGRLAAQSQGREPADQMRCQLDADRGEDVLALLDQIAQRDRSAATACARRAFYRLLQKEEIDAAEALLVVYAPLLTPGERDATERLIVALRSPEKPSKEALEKLFADLRTSESGGDVGVMIEALEKRLQ